MWRYSFAIATILLGSQILSAAGGDLNLHLCSNNETISVQILTKSRGQPNDCSCQAGPSQDPNVKEDYIHTPGVGSHKLHTNALNWNDARKACNEEGAHLAIINSNSEADLLVDMLKRAEKSIKFALNTEQALLGIHDLYKEGEWVTVFGESLFATGYSHWSPTYFGGQPDNFRGNQNCGAVINQGGLDDVFCHDKFAYFCEMVLTC